MFGTKMHRRVLRRPHRRRRRVPQRRAEGAARRGRGSTGRSSASTRPASTSCCTSSSGESFDRSRGAVGRDPRRHGAVRPPLRDGADSAVLVWSMGITQHAYGVDNVTRDREPRRWRAATSAGTGAGLMPIRGHSGVQGGAEMGAYATAFPGGVADRRRERGRGSPRPYGLPVPAAPGPDRGRDGRGRGARRARRALVERRQLPRRAARTRRRSRTRSQRVPLRVHQDIVVSSQMLVDPGEAVVLLPGRDPLRAARRRHRDHHRAARRVQPRDPRAAHRRGPQRVGDLRRPRAPRPTRPRRTSLDFADADAIRDEIARVVPAYEGIEHLRETGDAGPVGRRAPLRRRRVPDRRTARPASSSVAPAPRERPGRPVRAEHPPGQAVQLDGVRGDGPAHRAPAATRCPHRRRRRRRARGRATATRCCVRSRARRDAGPGAPRADPARQRPGVLPRGQRAAAAGAARTRNPGVPDYNAVVEIVPR